MINIFLDSKYVVFDYDGRQNRILTGHITDVTVKLQDIHNEKLYIEVFRDNKSFFRFPYDKVSIPSTDSAEALKEVILGYNLSNGVSLRFIAEEDQRQFTSTIQLPKEISAFIGGGLNTNWFSTSGYIINYTGPSFYGGEEVVIKC